MSAFSSLYANQYDTLYGEKDYISECDVLERAFAKLGEAPRTVLDVGCGTGSHSLELAKRGYECTGVDLSEAMLHEAVRKTSLLKCGTVPRWIKGDARSFNVSDKFDAGIMMFAVIGYMTTNTDVLSALRNIRSQLTAGAPFICDFWYGPAVLSVRPSDRVRVLGDGDRRTIRAASTIVDSFAHTADVSFRLWTLAGERFLGEALETHRMRYFFPQEFKLMLQSSGFESVSISAFPELEAEPSDETWNVLSLARAI